MEKYLQVISNGKCLIQFPISDLQMGIFPTAPKEAMLRKISTGGLAALGF